MNDRVLLMFTCPAGCPYSTMKLIMLKDLSGLSFANFEAHKHEGHRYQFRTSGLGFASYITNCG